MLALKGYEEKLVGENISSRFEATFAIQLEQFIAHIMVPDRCKDAPLLTLRAKQSNVRKVQGGFNNCGTASHGNTREILTGRWRQPVAPNLVDGPFNTSFVHKDMFVYGFLNLNRDQPLLFGRGAFPQKGF